MDDTAKQLMREHIKESEGVLLQPYKDSKGKLTIGTGFLVDDEASFVAKQLQIDDPATGERRLATEAEKKAGFKQAKSLSQEKLKDGASKFFLSEDENNRILDAEISNRIKKVTTDIGADAWNRLTDGQKTALVDIHYANGSLEKFPNLKEAAKRGDAQEMAKQADFHSGEIMETDPTTGKSEKTGFQYRNFDRLRRNYAAMLGIDPKSFDAYYAIADKYRDHPRLSGTYKSYLSREKPKPQSPETEKKSSPTAEDSSGEKSSGGTLLTKNGMADARILSDEERRERRMRALYPTMFA